MTPMQQGSAALRELFISLREAGFSEGQACQIVGTYLAATLTSTQGEES